MSGFSVLFESIRFKSETSGCERRKCEHEYLRYKILGGSGVCPPGKIFEVKFLPFPAFPGPEVVSNREGKYLISQL